MANRTVLFSITVALLLGTAGFASLADRRLPESLAAPLESIPAATGGWTKVNDQELPPYTLHALDPTAYLLRTYRKDQSQLDLFIAYYAQQRAGESMHSPKHCLPGGGWEIWRHDSAHIPVGGQFITVNKYSIANSGSRMLMFYWYQSSGRIVANEYLGKLLLAKDTLLTGHTAASLVRITLPDTPGATEDGIAFASWAIPQVRRCLGGGNLPIRNW